MTTEMDDFLRQHIATRDNKFSHYLGNLGIAASSTGRGE
jgi:hypothetical protein